MAQRMAKACGWTVSSRPLSPQSLNLGSGADSQESFDQGLTTVVDDGNQALVFAAGGAGNFDPSTATIASRPTRTPLVSGCVKGIDADGCHKPRWMFVKGSSRSTVPWSST